MNRSAAQNGQSGKSTQSTQPAQSTAQLLFRCARLLNAEALGRVRVKAGAPRLRPSHAALLPHLDPEGTRLTDLAARMGVSKQAVGQLVEELEGMGVVTRAEDAEDRRAKRVRFTPRGRKGLQAGLGVMRELEGELSSAIGQRRMEELHAILARLLTELESRGGGEQPGRSNGRRRS